MTRGNVSDVLQKVGLHFEDRSFATWLSGGEKQRKTCWLVRWLRKSEFWRLMSLTNHLGYYVSD